MDISTHSPHELEAARGNGHQETWNALLFALCGSLLGTIFGFLAIMLAGLRGVATVFVLLAGISFLLAVIGALLHTRKAYRAKTLRSKQEWELLQNIASAKDGA